MGPQEGVESCVQQALKKQDPWQKKRQSLSFGLWPEEKGTLAESGLWLSALNSAVIFRTPRAKGYPWQGQVPTCRILFNLALTVAAAPGAQPEVSCGLGACPGPWEPSWG